MQVEGQEYDPADTLGLWLDSAKDLLVPKVFRANLNRKVAMLPWSTRYTGQMVIGDEQGCSSSQRFILPSVCSQARHMALGLPFCTSTDTYLGRPTEYVGGIMIFYQCFFFVS